MDRAAAARPRIREGKKRALARRLPRRDGRTLQQTFFSLGHLGGLRSDKDYAALEILAGILGGGPQSRIADRLRTKLGIPNDVSAAWNAGYAHPGLFEISGSTKSVSTVATIKAIQEEIDRIRTAEVTEDEWRNAREAALNNLVFTNDSRAKLFARQMMLDYYGYPNDYLPQYQKALQSVTRADVLRVAKQYLNPANLTVVVAANPTMFGEPLEKLGPVTKLDLAIPEAKPEVLESTDASLAEGKQILLKAQAAAGGAEKLAAVKDYTMLAEYLIDPAVANIGGAKIVQTDKWIAPTTFRQDATLPAGRVTAYTDGKIGWISTPQGWGALAGVQRSQVLGDLFRVYYRLLLSDRLEGRTVNAIDATSVQITDTTGQVTSVEFDPQTHLPKRASYDTQQAVGAPIYSEDVYEDFRDVGGIKVPFKITINQGGRKFSDVVVKDYKINTGLIPTGACPKAAMKSIGPLLLILSLAACALAAETAHERGKRVVNEALQAVGGKAYLAMEDRVETGRAYSFFRQELEGLSIAKIYTRYLTPVPGKALRPRAPEFWQGRIQRSALQPGWRLGNHLPRRAAAGAEAHRKLAGRHAAQRLLHPAPAPRRARHGLLLARQRSLRESAGGNRRYHRCRRPYRDRLLQLVRPNCRSARC